VAGRPIFFTPLHDLEAGNASSLMRFRGQESESQALEAMSVIEADLESGVLLVPPPGGPIPCSSAARLAVAFLSFAPQPATVPFPLPPALAMPNIKVFRRFRSP